MPTAAFKGTHPPRIHSLTFCLSWLFIQTTKDRKIMRKHNQDKESKTIDA